MQWVDAFRLLSDYWKYKRNAINEYKIHSPFVFDLATSVFYDKHIYPEYRQIEALRSGLLQDTRIITVEDFGAGSRTGAGNQRKISSIARNSLKSAKYAQLLFRIARYYQPVNILELGTSLGVTSAYLALSHPNAKITTLEGAGNIAAVARENFNQLGLNNIECLTGRFEDNLTDILHSMQKVDFVYIDGNHKKAPTLSYFEKILPFTHNNTIIIFDDIYWSEEMKEAWKYIINNQSVTISIDLFQLGIVLFKKEKRTKEHFQIIL